MVEVSGEYFDIAKIAASGQCFRMRRQDGGSYRVIAGDRAVCVTQDGGRVSFACTADDYNGFWRHYFDMETDYAGYVSAIDPNDGYLGEAAAFGRGIRILNQELWETLVSFLISQQNNIPRIQRCIENICGAYGRECKASDGSVYHAFPEAEKLAALDDDALMSCNLGYRSKYVVRCARAVCSGEFDLEGLYSLCYDDAKKRLLNLYGVGEKVANCICLFALHHIEAFPVDTHIKQVLSEHYPCGFPFERYEGFAGVMQQFMFYHDLNKNQTSRGGEDIDVRQAYKK